MKSKNVKSWMILVVASALSLAPRGLAQHFRERGGYFNFGVGPAWTEDAKVLELPALGSPQGLQAKFDVGSRFDVAGGYQFNKWVAAEVETGFIYNTIESVGVGFIDGNLGNFPLTANIVFRVPNRSRLEPYIGGGGGVSFSYLTLDHASYPVPGGTLILHGTTTDAVYAYQGFAGLRYHFNDRMALSVSYKFLGTSNASWDVNGAPGHIRIEGVLTHTAEVGFTLRF
jgi:OOP family OmpA-OmpF porin